MKNIQLRGRLPQEYFLASLRARKLRNEAYKQYAAVTKIEGERSR